METEEQGGAARTPWDERVTRKVAGERTGGAYTLFEAEVGPGGGPPPHVQHREDECLYVLEGRFEFLIEAERVEAGPGSVVYVPKGDLHAFENTGGTTGRLLVIQTPGGAYEHLLQEAGNSAAEAAPDADRFTGIAAQYGMEVVPPIPGGRQGQTDGRAGELFSERRLRNDFRNG